MSYIYLSSVLTEKKVIEKDKRTHRALKGILGITLIPSVNASTYTKITLGSQLDGARIAKMKINKNAV